MYKRIEKLEDKIDKFVIKTDLDTHLNRLENQMTIINEHLIELLKKSG